MAKKIFRFFISMVIAIFFLWLALKDVSMQEVRLTLNKISWHWLLPYILISLLSHYIRSERWKQLIEQDAVNAGRMNLFSGVMFGYMVNYAVPRLGEISRSVYVGNREQISRSKILGTVVVERALDLLVMILLMIFVAFYLLRDQAVIVTVMGSDIAKWLQILWSFEGVFIMALLLVLALLLIAAAYGSIVLFSRWIPVLSEIILFLKEISKKFALGLLSIRDIRNWPLFVLFTFGIWFCYVLMTYIPFTAFNLHHEYGLGMQEALIITVISALGVAIPSPGGIGTYHWFVSRTLVLLFAVPEAVGVAYAIVTHLVMMLIILMVTPVLLIINRRFPQQQIGKPAQ